MAKVNRITPRQQGSGSEPWRIKLGQFGYLRSPHGKKRKIFVYSHGGKRIKLGLPMRKFNS